MDKKKARIAVLVSGGGTNLQAILDAQETGIITSGSVELVIASKAGAYALVRAENAGIEGCLVSRKELGSAEACQEKMLELLETRGIDMIVLAGYLSKIGPEIIRRYPDRILNIHPSLIPSFCGAGYYGLKVHEAALAKGVKVTGATVHIVNEIYDDGRIVAQKAVEVQEGDTPEVLQRRVMEQAEWIILPQAVEQLAAELVQGDCSFV